MGFTEQLNWHLPRPRATPPPPGFNYLKNPDPGLGGGGVCDKLKVNLQSQNKRPHPTPPLLQWYPNHTLAAMASTIKLFNHPPHPFLFTVRHHGHQQLELVRISATAGRDIAYR